MVPAVILAGGRSRRMGRDKLTLDINGTTLVETVVSRFAEEFAEVYLSVADADKYPDITVRKITDVYPDVGPMSGLHAALSGVEAEAMFVTAADLPYACPQAAKRIIELGAGYDACIIRLPDGKLEPLFGYYAKSLLPRCEEAIRAGRYQVLELYRGANVRYITVSELGNLWSDKLIVNINTPEDYDKIVNR